jgi:LacI family transcriptional regulator
VESTRSYARDLLTGIRRYVAAHGPWSTFLELRAEDSPPPQWLRTWDGDGILCRSFTPETAQLVSATGLPAVELRSTHLRGQRPFVGMDNARIGSLVAEHFLERGYPHFAVYGAESERFFSERIQNFVATLRARGKDCSVLPESASGPVADWEKTLALLMAWLRSLPKPVGILAVHDTLGARLLEACLRAEISVPEEVGVVGVENDETLCAFASPPLSSVRLNGVEAGFSAAQLLHRLMRGESLSPAEDVFLPPGGIVCRRSSDEFLYADGLVASAARLIRDEAPFGLNVEELCGRLHTSRSTLERRMKVSLQCTPKQEILRVRFREVERLLLETDLTVEAIAEQTGFLEGHHLQSAFKQARGITPGAFRSRSKLAG